VVYEEREEMFNVQFSYAMDGGASAQCFVKDAAPKAGLRPAPGRLPPFFPAITEKLIKYHFEP